MDYYTWREIKYFAEEIAYHEEIRKRHPKHYEPHKSLGGVPVGIATGEIDINISKKVAQEVLGSVSTLRIGVQPISLYGAHFITETREYPNIEVLFVLPAIGVTGKMVVERALLEDDKYKTLPFPVVFLEKPPGIVRSKFKISVWR